MPVNSLLLAPGNSRLSKVSTGNYSPLPLKGYGGNPLDHARPSPAQSKVADGGALGKNIKGTELSELGGLDSEAVSSQPIVEVKKPFVVRPESDSRIAQLIAQRPGKLERRRARIKASGEQLVFDFAPAKK